MQASSSTTPQDRSRRGLVGAIVLILGIAATSIGLSAGSTLAYTGPVITVNSSDSNKESYWGPSCTKLDQGGSTSWTATADYSLVVLKAGNFDYAFSNVVKGDVLTIPQNISHFIFCPPAPTTTTTQPATTTTTQPVVTTTTQPVITTTTTTQPVITTTTTTQPVITTTTTTQPVITTTTTTQPVITTTTEPSGGPTSTTSPTTTQAPTTTAATTTTAGPTTSETVEQLPPATTTTVVGSSGGSTSIAQELPRTGSDDTRPLVLIGMAMVGLGLALVLSSRRSAA